MKRFWQSIQILLNGFSLSEKEIGINGAEVLCLVRSSNIGRVFLRRPGRFRIIHLLVIFWPEGSRGDKRVADQFVPVLESIDFLIEIDDSLHGFLKEMRVAQVPVSRDEEDLFNGGGVNDFFQKKGKELVNIGLLVRDHPLVSFCRGEGR